MKVASPLQNLTRWIRNRGKEAPLAHPQDFSDLYECSSLAVFRYIYGLRGGPVEDVEDLTIETYARAWKARYTFQGGPENAALAWLLRIARHLVIDSYRTERARIQPLDDAPEDLPLLGPTPETLVALGEQHETLWKLLRQLSGNEREMIVLRYFLDWRVNQIGAYLHIAENTVSVTIRRALARLQQEWPDEKE